MIAPLALRRHLLVSLVTETFPPEINGVAMTLSRLVRALVRRGHTVQVVRPSQPQRAGDVPAEELGCEELLVGGFPIPGYPSLRLGAPAGGRLKQAWRERRPDVVHIATEGPLGWSALRAAESLRLPLSSSFHTNFHDYARHYGCGFLHRPVLGYLRGFHNRTRVTMVPSLDLITDLEAAGYRNLVQLDRGVDIDLFDPAHRDPELRRTWGAEDGAPVCLLTGRVAREKNIPLALAAFAAIRAQDPRARMVVVGDGPLRAPLAAAHPAVLFTGALPNRELARHYASADLFLFPSTSETWGNVLIEAMASGLACVAYDYAAARHHVKDGVNGLAVALGDEAGFTAAALRAAGDPALRASLGVEARRTAVPIAWERVATRFEDLLGRVAEEGLEALPV